jgi:hypothetical protein
MASINDLPNEIIENIFMRIINYDTITMDYLGINWHIHNIIMSIIKRKMPVMDTIVAYSNISKELDIKVQNEFKDIPASYNSGIKNMSILLSFIALGPTVIYYEYIDNISKIPYYIKDISLCEAYIELQCKNNKYINPADGDEFEKIMCIRRTSDEKFDRVVRPFSHMELRSFAAGIELFANLLYDYLDAKMSLINLILKIKDTNSYSFRIQI